LKIKSVLQSNTLFFSLFGKKQGECSTALFFAILMI